jgi:transposase-like protein
MRYTEEFKLAIINKILSPETTSIRSVAKENDLPIATVLTWLKQKDIDMSMKKCSSDESESRNHIEDSYVKKFNIILETASMSPEEVSAYCRRKGIYESDIAVWKQEMLDNLDSQNKRSLAKENKGLKIQLRELKSELKFKEKALAESAALLLVKKKASIIWGDLEDEE